MAAVCARRALALACALCALASAVGAEQAIVSVECYLARDFTLANLRVKRAGAAAAFEWLCPPTAAQAARAGAPHAELCFRGASKSAVGVVAKNLKGGVVGEVAFQRPDGTVAKCGTAAGGQAPKGAPLEASAGAGRQLSALRAACRRGGGLGRVAGAEFSAQRSAAKAAGVPGAAALAAPAEPCVDTASLCKADSYRGKGEACPTPGDVCTPLFAPERDVPLGLYGFWPVGQCVKPPADPSCVTDACINAFGKPCCGPFRCNAARQGTALQPYREVGVCVPDDACVAEGAACGGGDKRRCCNPGRCVDGGERGAGGVCARPCAAAGAACGTSASVDSCCGTGACIVPSDAPAGEPGACVADAPGCAALGAACSAGAFDGGCCNGGACRAAGEGKPGVCVRG